MIALKVRLCLHLFSGQRRCDDFQSHFEEGIALARLPVSCLSIDIVHHAGGALANPKSIALWTDLIPLGIVIVSIRGPPCENWSVARFQHLLDHMGPRPLCSLDDLWGVEGLTRKEHSQVDLGSALLRAMIHIVTVSKFAGAAALIEHPAHAAWRPGAPSSFLLPEMEWLSSLADVILSTIDQCMFGAPLVKPITQAISVMPNQGRCDKSHQHIVLKGRDSDGTYRTAPSKQFPDRTNCILAQGSVSVCVCVHKLSTGSTPWDDFAGTQLAPFYVPFDLHSDLQGLGQYGADFNATSTLKHNVSLIAIKPQEPSCLYEAQWKVQFAQVKDSCLRVEDGRSLSSFVSFARSHFNVGPMPAMLRNPVSTPPIVLPTVFDLPCKRNPAASSLPPIPSASTGSTDSAGIGASLPASSTDHTVASESTSLAASGSANVRDASAAKHVPALSSDFSDGLSDVPALMSEVVAEVEDSRRNSSFVSLAGPFSHSSLLPIPSASSGFHST